MALSKQERKEMARKAMEKRGSKKPDGSGFAKLDEERLAEIQKAGVEVFTTPDIKAFADATKDVWKTLDLDENLVKEFMAAAEQAAQVIPVMLNFSVFISGPSLILAF